MEKKITKIKDLSHGLIKMQLLFIKPRNISNKMNNTKNKNIKKSNKICKNRVIAKDQKKVPV